MVELFKNIGLAFIPIFVAVDAIGVLPVFSALTTGLSAAEKNKVVVQSMLTALCLSLGFIALGKLIFNLMGITVYDFMVAGGTILFCIAIIDIVNPVKSRRMPAEDMGAVPLGTPLIVGPAVLTTCLAILPHYGLTATVISVLANILLAGLMFKSASVLVGLLGEAGSKAVSKITSLLLASIAVMLVRKGLSGIVGHI